MKVWDWGLQGLIYRAEWQFLLLCSSRIVNDTRSLNLRFLSSILNRSVDRTVLRNRIFNTLYLSSILVDSFPRTLHFDKQ